MLGDIKSIRVNERINFLCGMHACMSHIGSVSAFKRVPVTFLHCQCCVYLIARHSFTGFIAACLR